MILSKLRNNHFLSFAGNAVVAGMGFCLYAVLAHNLATKAELGYWVFFIINVTLADIFRTGFLQNSLIKFYSGTDLNRSLNIAGSAWHIGFYITAIACIINLGFYLFYPGKISVEVLSLINWFGITFLSTLPYNVALWILQAEGRFGIILYIRIINQGVMIATIGVLIVLGKLSFTTTLYANLLSNVVTSLVAVFAGWAKIKTLRFKSRAAMAELFHYGKYSVGSSIGSQLLRNSDLYVINAMMGTASAAAVAVYNMPQRLMEIIEMPIRSFTSTAMPLLSAAANQQDEGKVAYIMKKYAGVLMLALLPVCIAGFLGAGLIINLVGGQKFSGSAAANIFRIFMTFAMLLPVDRFFGITLDMINKPRVNMIKVFVMLGVNIVADIAGLLIFHSIYGVALASILTFFTGIIYGYWSLKKYLKFSMYDIFRLGFLESGILLSGFYKSIRTYKSK
jgi:O-antigen/teichoic acid export membrane protein